MDWLEYNGGKALILEKDPQASKGLFYLTHRAMCEKEGLWWLDENRLLLAQGEAEGDFFSCPAVNLSWGTKQQWKQRLERLAAAVGEKKTLHLLALGDVGSTVLTALKLLGSDCLREIGIYDMNPAVCQRWESELNQAAYPWDYDALPEVKILQEKELFDCDVFVFCASKGIPPVGSDVKDVRMAQYAANRGIVSLYAKKAREVGFQGLFAVVSDPVDPLCRAAFFAANTDENGCFDAKGLRPEQIQGYGLGVMNARGAYYAKKDSRFASFLQEGRAFGPHGEDLVLANSIAHYDDALSKELTTLAVQANLRTRELGFKPYVAPAISSAAISLLLTLRGQWHYSSNALGGVWMGSKNRTTAQGLQIESLPLPQALYERLQHAYQALEAIE